MEMAEISTSCCICTNSRIISPERVTTEVQRYGATIMSLDSLKKDKLYEVKLTVHGEKMKMRIAEIILSPERSIDLERICNKMDPVRSAEYCVKIKIR